MSDSTLTITVSGVTPEAAKTLVESLTGNADYSVAAASVRYTKTVTVTEDLLTGAVTEDDTTTAADEAPANTGQQADETPAAGE